MTATTIRPATEDDVPQLVELLGAFVAASGYGRLAAYDPATGAATCRGLILSDRGVVLVAERAGCIVGAVGGVAAPAHWNAAFLAAGEVFLWVLPDCRDGAGRRLLAGLRRWAADAGVGALFLNRLISGDARVDDLYCRAGAVPVELLYVVRP